MGEDGAQETPHQSNPDSGSSLSDNTVPVDGPDATSVPASFVAVPVPAAGTVLPTHASTPTFLAEIARESGGRIVFLLQVLMTIVIDSAFVFLLYLWLQVVDFLAHLFGDLSGFYRVIVLIIEYASLVAPVIILVGLLVFDVIGALKRMWERRGL